MEKHYEAQVSQQKHFLFGVWKQQSNTRTVLSTSVVQCFQGLARQSLSWPGVVLAMVTLGVGH